MILEKFDFELTDELISQDIKPICNAIFCNGISLKVKNKKSWLIELKQIDFIIIQIIKIFIIITL